MSGSCEPVGRIAYAISQGRPAAHAFVLPPHRIQNSRDVYLNTQFLIVGSGIAALRAAIDLAPFGSVLILTKAETTEGSTGYAQGGIAAAVGDDDSPGLHAADTIAAGDGGPPGIPPFG